MAGKKKPYADWGKYDLASEAIPASPLTQLASSYKTHDVKSVSVNLFFKYKTARFFQTEYFYVYHV